MGKSKRWKLPYEKIAFAVLVALLSGSIWLNGYLLQKGAADNDTIAATTAKLGWFKDNIRKRPPLDVPAAEAVIDEEDE